MWASLGHLFETLILSTLQHFLTAFVKSLSPTTAHSTIRKARTTPSGDVADFGGEGGFGGGYCSFVLGPLLGIANGQQNGPSHTPVPYGRRHPPASVAASYCPWRRSFCREEGMALGVDVRVIHL